MAEPPSQPKPELGLADTVLADSSDRSQANASGTLHAVHGFDLATGEADVVPVFVDDVPSSMEGERYEEGPLLGAGGMGEVCLFRDRRVGRHVALKKLLPGVDNEISRRRFLREARVQGQLEHPAIVPVYDVDFDEHGLPYFSMKRVRGQTLSRVLELLGRKDADTEQRFGRRRLLSAFAQVCHAVHYAHVRGVVHRDLKPGNIMLGEYGEVYVLDWGVARIVREEDDDAVRDPELAVALEASTGLTRHGDLVGSVGYMAPEQMRGGSAIDARADVFALGVLLYELLTYKRFREGGTLLGVVERVLRGEKKLPSDVREDVPPELDALVARATFREPDDRIQTAGELAESVERYLEGDRDREARRNLAKEHLLLAEKQLSGSRTDALREVVKALAFDPESARAQALLLELLVDPKAPIPKEAEAELESIAHRLRSRGSRLATWGFFSMLLTVVLALWLGIKSWVSIGALATSCLACGFFSLYTSKQKSTPTHTYILALLTSILVALVSMLVGPFVLVPALAAAFGMYFVAHVTRAERRVVLTAIVLGAMAPYAIEATGWFPPAYAFEPGRIVLLSRVIDFPKVPSLVSFMYTNATFVALPAIFAGWMHDELMNVQRRIAFQAWQLKQVFPGIATTQNAQNTERRIA
jgi:serine/threonine protein kinase